MTYRCADNISLEILTPNHFLKPYAETNLLIKNPKDELPSSVGRKILVKSLEIRDRLLDRFKELWYEEYLLGLKDTFKNLHETKFENRVKVGDIVLVKNPAVKHQHWVLGRILELYPGADGKVRSVKLIRGKADYREKPIKPELHSLKHLYPLELSLTHDHTPIISQEIIDNVESGVDELDFRDIDDHNVSPMEAADGLASFDMTASSSPDGDRSGGALPAEVDLPVADLEQASSPAFHNDYRHRAISRRSRRIRPP